MKLLCCAAFALVLLAAPAAAVDMTTPITSFDGDMIYDDLSQGAVTAGKRCGEEGERRCLTLGIAIRNALLAAPIEAAAADTKAVEVEKFERGRLAQGLVGAAEVTLSPEDVVLFKRLIAKLYGPLVVYQVVVLLDPSKKK